MITSQLSKFVGKKIDACGMEIEGICKSQGFACNVQDPEFNKSNIDTDNKRVNVMTDANGVIKHIRVG